MTDFGGYRAMMVDFGVDPRSIDTMSLGQIASMIVGLSRRRGRVDVPSEEERAEKMAEFAQFAEMDPSVRIH